MTSTLRTVLGDDCRWRLSTWPGLGVLREAA
jgi:hypothetical protein